MTKNTTDSLSACVIMSGMENLNKIQKLTDRFDSIKPKHPGKFGIMDALALVYAVKSGIEDLMPENILEAIKNSKILKVSRYCCMPLRWSDEYTTSVIEIARGEYTIEITIKTNYHNKSRISKYDIKTT